MMIQLTPQANLTKFSRWSKQFNYSINGVPHRAGATEANFDARIAHHKAPLRAATARR